ncbi:terminase TerL endonuclease subunit [Paracoccus sp. SSK6]|uniref:terminase large subunit n=1 Tax=Paracoccus sp. SSK6 TaxID=3143131 RepID=UPI00321AFE18
MTDKVQTRGERNIEWIENHLYIPEGKFVGKPFQLAKFQRDIVLKIYDNPSGTRRAIISMPRKAAKSTLTAALLLLHLVGPEARPNSQLFSAARSRDQAALVYNLATKMVLFSPTLKPFVKIRQATKELYVPDLGTVYKALSKEAHTALGLSPVFVCHDELGAVRGPRDDLYEALETASAAQEDPLTVVISTQAPNDADLLSTLIDTAGDNPRTVTVVYACPPEVDAWSEEALKAHPAWDDFLNQQEMRDMQSDAKSMPARANSFRNLILNQRIEADAPFISKDIWIANGADPSSWRGKKVYGGLDLSQTTDLTALVMMSLDEETRQWSVHPFFWMPEDAVKIRSEEDKVPYDQWVKQGLIEAVPGGIIKYEWIASKLKVLADECDIQKIAFDRHNFKAFRADLERAQFSDRWIDDCFVEFGQGFVSMSPAIRILEEMVIDKRLRHGNNSVLTWNMNSVKVIEDATRNRKFVKKAYNQRIDGAIALTMAAGTLIEPEKKRGSYLDHSELLIL